MNDPSSSVATKCVPCICTTILGALVVVFAWWSVRWGAVILTVIGVLLILRGLVNQCCCATGACEAKTPQEPSATDQPAA